ncbi:hypothetical protein B0H13DRAFT_1014169 [Mycena leptocephala]|nr:hypothetical protein B0H13DRAFT_1014169 [Mycena leptocephala]
MLRLAYLLPLSRFSCTFSLQLKSPVKRVLLLSGCFWVFYLGILVSHCPTAHRRCLFTATSPYLFCHVTALASRTPSIPFPLTTRSRSKATPDSDPESPLSPLTPIVPTPSSGLSPSPSPSPPPHRRPRQQATATSATPTPTLALSHLPTVPKCLRSPPSRPMPPSHLFCLRATAPRLLSAS